MVMSVPYDPGRTGKADGQLGPGSHTIGPVLYSCVFPETETRTPETTA